jgi:hypothetical protein
MSVKCPSCGFDSPEGALFCDFCKEPFAKKKKADPLAGLSTEEILKKDLPPRAEPPAWLRPLAWTFLALILAVAAVVLSQLYSRYAAKAP